MFKSFEKLLTERLLHTAMFLRCIDTIKIGSYLSKSITFHILPKYD